MPVKITSAEEGLECFSSTNYKTLWTAKYLRRGTTEAVINWYGGLCLLIVGSLKFINWEHHNVNLQKESVKLLACTDVMTTMIYGLQPKCQQNACLDVWQSRQLSARLSGKAHKIFQKQPRLSEKSTKSDSKINTGGFPRATSSLKPNFGQTASPEKRKREKIWTPESDQILAKITPRGKLKTILLSSSFLYRFWSRISSIFDPKIVAKPIWRQDLHSSCCEGKLELPKLLIQMFCTNQNPLKRSEGRSKIDIAHVASYVNWPSKLESFLEWSSNKQTSNFNAKVRRKTYFGFSYSGAAKRRQKWCQMASKNNPGAASEAVHFGVLVFACPKLSCGSWVKLRAGPFCSLVGW